MFSFSLTGYKHLTQIPTSTDSSPVPRPKVARPLLSYHPFKAVYYALAMIILLSIRLPFWILTYTIPYLRPSSKWTFQRALLFSIIKIGLHIHTVCGIPVGARDHTRLNPLVIDEKKRSLSLEKIKSRAVWVQPISGDTLIKGQLERWIKDTEATRERIPGYWRGNNLEQEMIRAGKDEKVIYFLHGGGLCSSSAHPLDLTNRVVGQTLKACHQSKSSSSLPSRALSLEYRLVQYVTFPGVLLDALAGYNYLLNECGFQAKNIFVMGDSAGGLLSLSLARYLRDEKVLEMMGGLIGLSPWMDVSFSYKGSPSSSTNINSSTDMLYDESIIAASTCTLLGMPRDARFSPYLSPISLGHSIDNDLFGDFPKALFFVGGLEKFRDEVRDAVRWYNSDEERATLYEEELATHDWMIFPFGNHEESVRTVQRIVDWIGDF